MSPNPVGSLFSRAPMFGLHQSVVHATNQAFGIVGWVASQTHAILPLSLSQGSNREHLQLVQEFVSVDIRLLSGAEVKLRIECHQPLSSITELVSLQTGIPQARQIFLISETKRTYRGIGAAARDLAHCWTARKSTMTLVLGMVNYMFLPEVMNREFSGRGLYHWARGCLRQCMQDVSHKAQGTITLQVETLSGLTLALNLSADASLRDMQTLVQQEAGVLLDRQHITIQEGLPPSRLVQLTNHLLLGSFAGLRVAGQAAFWAHARIRRQWQDGSHFPLQVRTDCGQVMTIDATMQMTLHQVHQALSSSTLSSLTHLTSAPHIQEITFPPLAGADAVRKSVLTGVQHSIVS